MPNRSLTDDDFTLAPRARSVRAYVREGVDRLAGADPGLKQLQSAGQAVLGIAAAVGLVYVFVRTTGAMQRPIPHGATPTETAGDAAATIAANHALLIVAMLLGGIVAMMSAFTVNDNTARGQLISTLLLPLPMIAAMSLGLVLGRFRILSLVFLVVLLTLAVYVRRWGPRGVAAGMVAFNGGFLGLFLHAQIGIGDIGWLAADLAIGLLASLLVRFGLFRPNPERTLARMRRSWESRGARLIALSAEVLSVEPAEAGAVERQLRRQLVRLNESTLMIDAQLAQSVPQSADLQAQRLFDAELALSNCARFAAALASTGASPELRQLGRDGLTTVLGDNGPAAIGRLRSYVGSTTRHTVLAHRLGASLEEYARARQQLYQTSVERVDAANAGGGGGGGGGDRAQFSPAVDLNSGFLPGSVPVSTQASTTPGRGRRLDHPAMPPYVRASIQIAVAASIAVVLGDLVSGSRLYWAVLVTFLAFMATTNSGEQVRKAVFRVTGTAIGIVLGDLLVRVTGGHIWSSLLIVLVALFFGIYLIRINYTFMVIGVTVTLSQLYAQLGEFSWHLLLLRLGETAIGVGAVTVTVLLIVPLRPQRVLTAGVLLWFRALARVLDDALTRLTDGTASTHPSPRAALRDLDAAFAALEATAAPLRSTTFGRNSAQLSEISALSAATRGYARTLAVEAQAAGRIDSLPLRRAADQLRLGLAAIDNRISSGEHGEYVRSASLIELATTRLDTEGDTDSPAALALRDLTLLDGALARLAQSLQMSVRDHDTTAGRSAPKSFSEVVEAPVDLAPRRS